MALTTDQVEEIKILTHFHMSSLQEGIKVHESAGDGAVAATQRLFEKKLISQFDGGYLTDLGIEAAEHAQAVITILNSK